MKFCADLAQTSSFSTTSLGYKLITIGWDPCLLEFKHLFPFDFWLSLSLSFCLHPASQGVYYRGPALLRLSPEQSHFRGWAGVLVLSLQGAPFSISQLLPATYKVNETTPFLGVIQPHGILWP